MLENIEKNKDLFIRSLMRGRNCSFEEAEIMFSATTNLEINRNYFIRFLMKKNARLDEAEDMFSALKIKTIEALDRGSLKYDEKKFFSWARETMKNTFIDYIRKIMSRDVQMTLLVIFHLKILLTKF